MCSEKCGGSNCNGKCGSLDLSCRENGLVDTAAHFLNERQKFEESYQKKEQILRKILTKVIFLKNY